MNDFDYSIYLILRAAFSKTHKKIFTCFSKFPLMNSREFKNAVVAANLIFSLKEEIDMSQINSIEDTKFNLNYTLSNKEISFHQWHNFSIQYNPSIVPPALYFGSKFSFFTIFTIKSLPKQQFFSHQIKNVIKCNNYSLGFFVAHSGDNRTQNYCCVVCEKLRILEEIWVWTMKKRNFHTKSKIFGQLLTLSSQD